ncbi:hypothetical protein ERO13_A13G232100v2 [Gossypium hirsutum]|uniref:Uncharacterized protein n=4 Tax=Gossypium TaxID=3633 RepID=A0A5J5T4F0_GOSBA|nr:P-loop NTPase domain-containing protein LPA1 homolog 2-like [Gossypium hirsutum]KAB2050551.1 hypothetical protein ES319_A13G254200v1 [Gossypium barbadense]KAB2050552.1 hypothetical protein ES319_A13G254200v1 [Gossypium barbadense]KAG4168007.1 hypothetical protein ERO13_A13G232100v2 [Gossypium hirsutum]TYG88119.1 hypothetical protein ES288_A13G269600v1 [Gossypium darwinii]
MGESAKVLYIVVVDEGEKGDETLSFRYTRPVLQGTLQLMGCKARHAFKISQRTFELITRKSSYNSLLQEGSKTLNSDGLKGNTKKEDIHPTNFYRTEAGSCLVSGEDNRDKSIPFELYKRRTSIVVTRKCFLDVVCQALYEYKYVGPSERADLILACRIRERKESITVLLCGTSGCGKSTLSALLASRLGITTVISTDSIRHMMRSFVDEKENPLLWASTYHAGECLDPVAVAQAKAKKKAKKLAGTAQSFPKGERADGSSASKCDAQPMESGSICTELIGPKQIAVEGFKAQSEMVIDSLDRLITAWEERKESVIIEGVHLSLTFVMGLMRKHPSIIPFMIYISNEDKHLERFAVRAKYMTLDPAKNKYVKYIKNIRAIQDYLCKRADKHLVPKINNTNVDRSVAAIHATVFSCFRRHEAGEPLYDPVANTVGVIYDEYKKCAANSLSSKGMFQLIQRQGSSRQLMALLNTDGSVAKAWPVKSVDSNGRPISGHMCPGGVGLPLYGPLQIGKAEPVNLQFGNFGISAWPSDGGTSRAGSVDDLRCDAADTGSRHHSSCGSSPRMSDGPAKELKEEISEFGSDDEEVDDPPEVDSDEDFADRHKQFQEEVGSVDEGSTKSDEEYDDLAMEDMVENDDRLEDEDRRGKVIVSSEDQATPTKGDKASKSDQLSVPREKSEKGFARMRKRSLSNPDMKKHVSIINDCILSRTPER